MLIIDWQARQAFVIVGKAIGSGLILRAYEISFRKDDDSDLTLDAGSEPTAETTAKLTDVDDSSPLNINAELLAGQISIRASRAKDGSAATELRFDRHEKTFTKSTD